MRTAALIVAATLIGAQDARRDQVKAIENAVGTVTTICGTVKAYKCVMQDKTTRLELDAEPPIDVVVASADRKVFGIPPEVQYLHRRICATGRLTKDPDRAGYQLQLTGPADARVETTPPEGALLTHDPDAYSPCDPGVSLPRVLKEAKPQYTSDAMRAKVQGGVLVGAVVGVDGITRNVIVVRSLDRLNGLDDEALTAVRQWRFAPGTVGGRPVPMRITIEMTFTLR